MNSSEKRTVSLFVEGPIRPEFIAASIAKHQAKTGIGAHEIFLGQIRADKKGTEVVEAIEFSAYREMAEATYLEFREQLFARHPITCMHVYHSLGRVRAGDLNLFVFVSAERRVAAMEACRELVEWIKRELPVWGKEVFSTASVQWKVNT
jgi:molybdopterin synthase catalytic subunit